MLAAHEFDDDAVCIHCGFDGAEYAWLNSVRLDRYPHPAPLCLEERERDLAEAIRKALESEGKP